MSTSNGLRAKLRTVREQNCVRSESKIAYGLRAKLRMVREQKRAGAESKNAYELRAVVYIGFRHYAIYFFSLKKWLPDVSLARHPFVTFPRAVNILRQRKAAILDP